MSAATALDKLLEEYRAQVLRWNRQINLVSRRESAGRLTGLIQQCRSAWDDLMAARPAGLESASGLWYFDLGSGAGLPGFVWHHQAIQSGLGIRTWLVEPREKRAWFLDRLNHLEGAVPATVVAGRWGDPESGILAGDAAPSHILVSLKALHLTDPEVLAGLAPVLAQLPEEGSPPVLIARFYPSEQVWSEELAGDLDIPPAGEERIHGRYRFLAKGGRILAPGLRGGAGLVLSEYLAESS